MKTKFLLIMKPAWTEIKCRITWERREKLKEVLWYWLGRGSVFEWSTKNKKKNKNKNGLIEIGIHDHCDTAIAEVLGSNLVRV